MHGAFPEGDDPGTEAGKGFVELWARLDCIARGHARWWEWAPPLLWLRRGTVLRSHVRDALEALLLRVEGDETNAKDLRAAIALRTKELDEAEASRTAGGAVSSDATVLGREERVLEASYADAMRAKERGRMERSRAVVAGAAAARSELLRSERCADLLANAGVVMRIADERAEGAEDVEDAVENAAVADLQALREPRGDQDRRR